METLTCESFNKNINVKALRKQKNELSEQIEQQIIDCYAKALYKSKDKMSEKEIKSFLSMMINDIKISNE